MSLETTMLSMCGKEEKEEWQIDLKNNQPQDSMCHFLRKSVCLSLSLTDPLLAFDDGCFQLAHEGLKAAIMVSECSSGFSAVIHRFSILFISERSGRYPT
jgi:hypothetical protein